MKNRKWDNAYRVKCKCGHSIEIYTKIDFTVCSFCHSTVCLNDKARFKYELGKVMKKRFLK